jgi:hypothetical protein
MFIAAIADTEPDSCPGFTSTLIGMVLSISGAGILPEKCAWDQRDALITALGQSALEVTIHLGPDITGIEPACFYEGSLMITVDAANQNLVAVDGALYTKDFSALLAYPMYGLPIRTGTDNFLSREETTIIGPYAFAANKNLKRIELTNVQSIEAAAFQGVAYATELILPSTLIHSERVDVDQRVLFRTLRSHRVTRISRYGSVLRRWIRRSL